MTLFDNLQAIAHMVQGNLQKMKNNEDATINVSVAPFIRALGYNTQDLDEVYPQYPILNTDAVDYAILRDDIPVFFVEAKAAGNNLQHKEWKQLFQYFNAEIGLRYGILTNGVDYRFYTDLKADNIMDKEPFLTLNMLNLDKRLAAELEGFAKEGYNAEQIRSSAQKLAISRLLAQEFSQPSKDFTKHFARQIHSGGQFDAHMPHFARLVKQAWRDLVEQEIANRLQRSSRENEDEQDEASVPLDSSEVVEVPVFATHSGRRFEATLLVDEVMNWHKRPIQLSFEGELMTANNATLTALRSINPNRKTGKSNIVFWRFIHPKSGEDLPIKAICDDVQRGGRLRQELAAKYM